MNHGDEVTVDLGGGCPCGCGRTGSYRGTYIGPGTVKAAYPGARVLDQYGAERVEVLSCVKAAGR